MTAPPRIGRLWRHLLCDRGDVRRAFPAEGLTRIEQRIVDGETRHGAEIRIAIEASLHPLDAWRRMRARDRALEVFGRLRVWDTEGNNGVLVYVLLADRAVEVVADRAAARAVPDDAWREIARAMGAAFREGRFVDGVLAAIDRLEPLLASAFPAGNRNPDELPNRPSIL